MAEICILTFLYLLPFLLKGEANPQKHSNDVFCVFSRVHATLQVTLSVCRSVGLSVGRSHFAFFAFLGYLQVGKHIFEYFKEL